MEHQDDTRHTSQALDASITSIDGIGPKSAKLLAQLGIEMVRDLLFHFPRDYQDRRRITPVAEAEEGQTVTIEVEIVGTRTVRLRRNMSIAVATLRDATGEIHATWFGRGFLAKAFVKGARGLFTGVVGKYNGLALKNPEFEMLSGDAEDASAYGPNRAHLPSHRQGHATHAATLGARRTGYAPRLRGGVAAGHAVAPVRVPVDTRCPGPGPFP